MSVNIKMYKQDLKRLVVCQ